MIKPVQLELFPALPVRLPPPRRLRHLGLELELLELDIAELAYYLRVVDRHETDLAELVAEARAAGRVVPKAYGVVVKSEELRQIADEKLRDAHALYRALERRLHQAIDRHLKRKRLAEGR
jgi:hypothetical protein